IIGLATGSARPAFDSGSTHFRLFSMGDDSPGAPVPLPPEKASPLKIGRFETAPVIDGVLDDVVWRMAATLKDFYQTNPGDNTRPSFPTEVKIGFDAHNLYLAFHAYDDPAGI